MQSFFVVLALCTVHWFLLQQEADGQMNRLKCVTSGTTLLHSMAHPQRSAEVPST